MNEVERCVKFGIGEAQVFRKKPVEVVACRYAYDPTDSLESTDSDFLNDLAAWCGGTVVWGEKGHAGIDIPTLEGTMRANPGDWIIKGVQGEFYPCKPDIFEATYEAVDE